MPSLEKDSQHKNSFGRGDRIVIAGASSLLGAELKSMLEESRFAEADFRLVDEEFAAGTLTEAGGGAAVIQPVDEDSFARARFVFFTGSPEFTRAKLAASRLGSGAVIDLSGGSLGDKETRLWYPGSKLQGEAGRHYGVLSAPGTVAAALLDALNRVGLFRLGLIFFRPVSEAGRAGIEELESQTSQLLSFQSIGQPLFDSQVAFNLLNRYGSESRENLSSVQERIRKEVEPFVGKRGVLPSICVVHAPVFYGYMFAAIVETAEAATPEKLADVCKEAGFTLWAEEDGPLGNVSANESMMTLCLPKERPTQTQPWWCWGAADNIRLPAANALKLAEMLL